MLILVGDFENPKLEIEIENDLLLIIKGHINYGLLPASLKILSELDVFKITELTPEDNRTIMLALLTTDLVEGIEEDLSFILLELKKAFTRAVDESLLVYGVGD
ncbi:MAG: hypothetical protein JEZ08_22425 [Clostridiales bacterium]|nr:hypothetical protein [Clostridiales bacterium]